MSASDKIKEKVLGIMDHRANFMDNDKLLKNVHIYKIHSFFFF